MHHRASSLACFALFALSCKSVPLPQGPKGRGEVGPERNDGGYGARRRKGKVHDIGDGAGCGKGTRDGVVDRINGGDGPRQWARRRRRQLLIGTIKWQRCRGQL